MTWLEFLAAYFVGVFMGIGFMSSLLGYPLFGPAIYRIRGLWKYRLGLCKCKECRRDS
jgi:hypothetical protein